MNNITFGVYAILQVLVARDLDSTTLVKKDAIEQVAYMDFLAQPEPTLPEPEPMVMNMKASFYTAFCDGCIGITKAGSDVSNTIYVDGFRVIAVDPKVIPLGTIVRVDLENGDSFEAIADDTGGAIKGVRIDILVSTTSEAVALGRQDAIVTIIKEVE